VAPGLTACASCSRTNNSINLDTIALACGRGQYDRDGTSDSRVNVHTANDRNGLSVSSVEVPRGCQSHAGRVASFWSELQISAGSALRITPEIVNQPLLNGIRVPPPG